MNERGGVIFYGGKPEKHQKRGGKLEKGKKSVENQKREVCYTLVVGALPLCD